MSERAPKWRIGLILFPQLTLLDLPGPAEVFGRMPRAEVHLLWKTLKPVRSDRGLSLLPTMTFADCPHLDVVCVPGGPGQIALMQDEETLEFLRRVAPGCRLVTSVCTGSLVLGAAGLLAGYRATCHWSSIDQLALLGAAPVEARVVRDRNRITGAGVTSGIDFALTVVAELAGAAVRWRKTYSCRWSTIRDRLTRPDRRAARRPHLSPRSRRESARSSRTAEPRRSRPRGACGANEDWAIRFGAQPKADNFPGTDARRASGRRCPNAPAQRAQEAPNLSPMALGLGS
jgi:cyclohexyl-isocyanide hydratase